MAKGRQEPFAAAGSITEKRAPRRYIGAPFHRRADSPVREITYR